MHQHIFYELLKRKRVILFLIVTVSVLLFAGRMYVFDPYFTHPLKIKTIKTKNDAEFFLTDARNKINVYEQQKERIEKFEKQLSQFKEFRFEKTPIIKEQEKSFFEPVFSYNSVKVLKINCCSNNEKTGFGTDTANNYRNLASLFNLEELYLLKSRFVWVGDPEDSDLKNILINWKSKEPDFNQTIAPSTLNHIQDINIEGYLFKQNFSEHFGDS